MKEKKKLLIATDNFLPRWDGISRFLLEIMPELCKTYDVHVVAPNFGSYKHENFKVTRIPLSKYSLGDYTSAKYKPATIKKLVKDADIIFSQTIGVIGATAIRYAKKMRKPTVSYMHSIEWELVPMATNKHLLRRFLYPFMKTYSRNIYNKCSLILAPSESIAEKLGWQKINVKKKVVHLGVNSKIFCPLKEKSEKEQSHISVLREKLGLENFYVLGNHGRIAEEKDIHTILRAFRWLQKKHDDVKLILIGDGVKHIIDKISRMENVVYVKRSDEVQNYLNLMDVYIMTSLTETTSLSTLEAMSSGLPVISTPVGYIREYIKNNYNGFLIDIGDNFALYKNIDLLKNNPELMKKIGVRARRSVLTSFEWSNTAKGIVDALKEISE